MLPGKQTNPGQIAKVEAAQEKPSRVGKRPGAAAGGAGQQREAGKGGRARGGRARGKARTDKDSDPHAAWQDA